MKTESGVSTLSRRDITAETDLLSRLGDYDYLMLQRDWNSERHGDLDIVVSARHWPGLVATVLGFSETMRFPVVKAYEIEHAVVCIILLTADARIHMDVCITPPRKTLFGVELEDALVRREKIQGVYVAGAEDAKTYAECKRRYKSSPLRKIARKLINIPTLARRAFHATLLMHGALVYTPFVLEPALLRSTPVRTKTLNYLKTVLLPKYATGTGETRR
jgi:hypothetical protein